VKLALIFLPALVLSCAPSQGKVGPGGRRDMAVPVGSGGGGGGDTGGDMSIGGAYDYDLAGMGLMCVPPQTATMCPNPIAANAGCGPVEDCGPSGHGNGLDDNCNGVVDEGCGCSPGNVESCFLGPPGKHNIGACSDGHATCQGDELGSWGPCVGSISPSAEICDKLDNDCNGCADDGLCCDAAINCPAPGDPRIAPQPPYVDVALKGELFFTAAATSWSWTIVGGPCDRMFYMTTAMHNQSFTLMGANTRDAVAHFTLSGDYTVTLTVVGADGKTYTCTWVQHINGPGLRFELCWDNSDSDDDIDLHVHKPGTTTNWFTTDNGTTNNTDDCYYINCKAEEYPNATPPATAPQWSYANSPIAQCIGSPEGATWSSGLMACHNPRLDIDNVGNAPGRPENTNIDNPQNGQSFRGAVQYYRNVNTTSDEHPMVNVYCGGTLKATFGQAPNTLTGFNKGGGYNAGLLWRVADVQVQVDGMGNTTGCTVTALHPPGTATGFWVTNNMMTY
jgi:hypothetical protein